VSNWLTFVLNEKDKPCGTYFEVGVAIDHNIPIYIITNIPKKDLPQSLILGIEAVHGEFFDNLTQYLKFLDEKYNYSRADLRYFSETILGNIAKKVAQTYLVSKGIEKVKEIPGSAKSIGKKGIDKGIEKIKGIPGGTKILAKNALAGTTHAAGNVWQNVKNQMNPFHAQGKFMSVDDLFKEPSELARERSNRDSLAAMRSRQDEYEKNTNKPNEFTNSPYKDKKIKEQFGVHQMEKTFDDFITELNDKFDGNLLEVFTTEILVDIILDETLEQEIVDAAVVTLYNRGEISEDDLMELIATDSAPSFPELPAPKTNAIAIRKPTMPNAGGPKQPSTQVAKTMSGGPKEVAIRKNTMPTNRPVITQKALPWEKVVGSGTTIRPDVAKNSVPASSTPRATLGSVGKSALGAAGRLASKYSPHATALVGGYEAGKELNKTPAVNRVTDKIGKSIASGLQKIGIGSAPEVVRAKSPEVSRKAPDTGSKTNVPSKSDGGIVTFPKAVAPKTATQKPVSPKPMSQKVLPKPAMKPAMKTSEPRTPDVSDDLRASVAKMRSATSDMASKTGAMKSSLQKIAPAGRSERPITKGGMSSSQIHNSIRNLGGEPTTPTPKAIPKAAVSGGAPTTAIGSKPPPLDRSTARKM
ncbi:MAG: hypothetical protein ACOYLO_16815, partial [Ferruginibacter sp.]